MLMKKILKSMENTFKFIIFLLLIAYMLLWTMRFLSDWMMSMVRPFSGLTTP